MPEQIPNKIEGVKQDVGAARERLKEIIEANQQAGQDHFYERALAIPPEAIIKNLTDEDVSAFEEYYLRFQGVIENNDDLPVEAGEAEKILEKFDKDAESFNRQLSLLNRERGEGDIKNLSRRDLWAFLANKLTRVRFKIYLSKHPDKAEKLAHKKK